MDAAVDAAARLRQSHAMADPHPDTRRCLRPRVIVTRELPDRIQARMEALFDTVPSVDDAKWSAETTARRRRRVRRAGADRDRPDRRRRDRRRRTAPAPDRQFGAGDTADLTMALIVSVPRRLAEGEKLVRSGEWAGWSPSGMLGHRIGRQDAGHRRHGPDRPGGGGARPRLRPGHPLPQPPSPARRAGGATGRDLARGIWMICSRRGGIVDEEALVDALEQGRLAGAGLDVWEHEPRIDPRLLALPNVVMTPHMGSATYESRVASGEKVIQNIRAWADGHRPPDQRADRRGPVDVGLFDTAWCRDRWRGWRGRGGSDRRQRREGRGGRRYGRRGGRHRRGLRIAVDSMFFPGEGRGPDGKALETGRQASS
ncbi:hypothetical protein SASPL_155911 [Salvia splendens]|uniref:D-isomer specific 2-hydroxyacid dehydrogenase NAD-binding domain-containing protein n=1 Tax=Salvia splendens TaxID=180675 RepID=A0A8X8YXP2_SALSN|nr:hypothetical protein SASPL_155911 [Salvia splendens]